MVTHELKVLSKFFPSLVDMSKPFEIRSDDRHYAVGDTCIFKEIHMSEWNGDPDKEDFIYSGRKCVRRVTYVLSHEMWNMVPKGCVILGLKEVL